MTNTRAPSLEIHSGLSSTGEGARGPIVIDLPMPPTANNLFPTSRNGKRYCSPQYKAWKETAGKVLMVDRPGRIVGKVVIDIAVSEKARGDCANREKATVDLLVAHGVIEGDSKAHVRSVKTHWASDLAQGVRVTVSPVGE